MRTVTRAGPDPMACVPPESRELLLARTVATRDAMGCEDDLLPPPADFSVSTEWAGRPERSQLSPVLYTVHDAKLVSVRRIDDLVALS